jgi:hypothetical protein
MAKAVGIFSELCIANAPNFVPTLKTHLLKNQICKKERLIVMPHISFTVYAKLLVIYVPVIRSSCRGLYVLTTLM